MVIYRSQQNLSRIVQFMSVSSVTNDAKFVAKYILFYTKDE